MPVHGVQAVSTRLATRTCRTPCASRWCRSTRSRSLTPFASRSTSSMFARSATRSRGPSCRSTRFRSPTRSASRSTNSTSARNATRCAAGGRVNTRSPCRTRFASRSTNNTFASSATPCRTRSCRNTRSRCHIRSASRSTSSTFEAALHHAPPRDRVLYGRGAVHGVPAGLRAARCQVPVTCTRQVVDYRTECRVGHTTEMVETTHCVKVCGGEWQEVREYCPGPVVTQCCKSAGCWKFDPVLLLSRYLPGLDDHATRAVPRHLDLQESLVFPKERTRPSSAACRFASRTRTRFKFRVAEPSATR